MNTSKNYFFLKIKINKIIFQDLNLLIDNFNKMLTEESSNSTKYK